MEIKKRYLAVAVLLGAVLAWLIINLGPMFTYLVGCCWINGEKQCLDCGEWDGNCSSPLAMLIQDECCIDVRMCSGQVVDNPDDCKDKYCQNSGEWCVPVYDVATSKYTCHCKDVYEPL